MCIGLPVHDHEILVGLEPAHGNVITGDWEVRQDKLAANPLQYSTPSVVTVKLTLANSTPSAKARKLWLPSPNRFQLKV